MLDIISKINSTIVALEDMRSAGLNQKVQSIDYIDSYLSCLNTLKNYIQKNEKITKEFKIKWGKHMGGVHRFFEMTSVEDSFYEIDDDIKKIS